MEKLTFAQIKDKLGEDPHDWVYGNDLDTDGFGNVVHIQSGGAGNVSYYDQLPVFRIFHFVDHDVFIKFNGWFSSYGEIEFESMEEVRPVEKLVTVYETINK